MPQDRLLIVSITGFAFFIHLRRDILRFTKNAGDSR
jgi:hypothetical protein